MGSTWTWRWTYSKRVVAQRNKDLWQTISHVD